MRAAGDAPARNALAPFVGLGLASSLDLTAGYYTGRDLAAETHFLRIRNQRGLPADTQVDFEARLSVSDCGICERFVARTPLDCASQ